MDGRQTQTNYQRNTDGTFAVGRIRKPLDERFWAQVNKDGPTMPGMESPCWIWCGAIVPTTGYGAIGVDGSRPQSTHRVGWKLQRGPIPPGKCVLHRCDNRPCVRGDHLFLGTRADNNADMTKKGRARRGQNNPRGADHWTHKHPEKVLRGDKHPARRRETC